MGAKKPKADKTEENRQAQISAGTTQVNDIFSKFDEPFYDARKDDYSSWAMPQVDDQYAKAKNDLLFALARQYGTTQTSEASDRQAKLAKDYGLAKTNISDQAIAAANKARSSVENQRSAILSQLSASADPQAAATSASNQIDILSTPEPYSDLGQLFGNVTEGLAASQYPYGVFNQPTTSYGSGGTTPAVGKKASYTVG